jgi:arginine decarboxylase
MMDGPGGFTLTHDAVREAIACRQAIARIHAELADRGEWFFRPWNAPSVQDVGRSRVIPFHLAPPEWLANSADGWLLRSGEAWHGFGTLPDGWVMLDPTKVGIVAPGMGDDGVLAPDAIPADLVTAYLTRHSIVPSRTTDHMVLFLFTIGVTKGKWGTLVNALLDFKRDYDANCPIEDALPSIAAGAPARYAGLGLRDLAREMAAHLIESRQGYWQARACAELPTPIMTPRRAFQRLMAGDADVVPLDRMASRVSAVGIIPYPPGIPVVMPGESLGSADSPWLSYLQALQRWGRRFPGFGKEVEGAELRDGQYFVYCLED